MPRASSEPLTKVTLNIYRDDWEWANNYYAEVGGPSKILRELLRQHREATLRKAAQSLSAVERAVAGLEIKLEIGQ